MKAASGITDFQSMMEQLAEQDVASVAKAQGELEDEIFLFMDKIEALSGVQCQLDSCDPPAQLPNRMYYSRLLHDQILALRQTLNHYFN